MQCVVLKQKQQKILSLLLTGIDQNHRGRMNHLVTTDADDKVMHRPFGDMISDDWDRRPSELAEEQANRIWDMTLSEIYSSHPDPRVSMWCEWIKQAVYTQWLKDQEGNE